MLMKKFVLLLPLLICSLSLSSCKDDTEQTDTYPPDTSLAGSVYMDGYTILEAQGTYNGIAFKNLQPKQCFLDVWKVSDTEIYMYVIIVADGTTFRVQIPIIPLTGKSYDVAFDYTSNDVFIMHNETKYFSNAANVQGWIRRKYIKVNNNKTRSPLVRHDYHCEINISCTIDNKPLTIKIMSVTPHSNFV